MSFCRPALLACLAMVPLAVVPGCTRTFDVERRETPVHVWLTVPALAERGGQIDALVYVGPYKVVEGPVHFPQGTPTVVLPMLFIREGEREVRAAFDRGRAKGSQVVMVEGESWVQLVVSGSAVFIDLYESQPSPWGE